MVCGGGSVKRTKVRDASAIQEHSDRLDEALALIQRVSQVTELARVERLAIIKALAESAQPDR